MWAWVLLVHQKSPSLSLEFEVCWLIGGFNKSLSWLLMKIVDC